MQAAGWCSERQFGSRQCWGRGAWVPVKAQALKAKGGHAWGLQTLCPPCIRKEKFPDRSASKCLKSTEMHQEPVKWLVLPLLPVIYSLKYSLWPNLCERCGVDSKMSSPCRTGVQGLEGWRTNPFYGYFILCTLLPHLPWSQTFGPRLPIALWGMCPALGLH